MNEPFSLKLGAHTFSSNDEMAECLLRLLIALYPHTSDEFKARIEEGADRYAQASPIQWRRDVNIDLVLDWSMHTHLR